MKSADLRAAQAKAMSEAALAECVRDTCKALDLHRYHTYDSRRSTPGFPDEVIVGSRGVLFRELKRQGEKPTAEQAVWLARLSEAGADAGVWRPEDWFTGRIAAEIKAIR